MAVLDIPSNFKLTVGIISYDNLTLGLLEGEIITCDILLWGNFTSHGLVSDILLYSFMQ